MVNLGTEHDVRDVVDETWGVDSCHSSEMIPSWRCFVRPDEFEMVGAGAGADTDDVVVVAARTLYDGRMLPKQSCVFESSDQSQSNHLINSVWIAFVVATIHSTTKTVLTYYNLPVIDECVYERSTSSCSLLFQ